MKNRLLKSHTLLIRCEFVKLKIKIWDKIISILSNAAKTSAASVLLKITSDHFFYFLKVIHDALCTSITVLYSYILFTM